MTLAAGHLCRLGYAPFPPKVVCHRRAGVRRPYACKVPSDPRISRPHAPASLSKSGIAGRLKPKAQTPPVRAKARWVPARAKSLRLKGRLPRCFRARPPGGTSVSIWLRSCADVDDRALGFAQCNGRRPPYAQSACPTGADITLWAGSMPSQDFARPHHTHISDGR